jgi:hypothetical protein
MTDPVRPVAPREDEELAVAMLAACEATIRHLWDIAARFDTKECNLIRDEIHRLNTITLPAIQDLRAAAPVPCAASPADPWEGDLPTEHLNRCKLRDNLLYANIFNDDGSHRATWRCRKRAGHDGPCSSHNDCGVMNGGVVCGLLPGHAGPHAWQQFIRATGEEPK